MDQITITEAKMLQLIELVNNAEYNLAAVKKEFNKFIEMKDKNPEPFAPSIDQLNAYLKIKKSADAGIENYQKEVANNDTILKNARMELMRALPKNKWLKVGKYYVGHQTDNWPSSDGTLFIKTEKPTAELFHLTVN